MPESRDSPLSLAVGRGWYRQLLIVTLIALCGPALAVAIVAGSHAVVWVGCAALVVGIAFLALWRMPWLEQEWPLEGKESWLVVGLILSTSGLLLSLIGLALRS